MRPYSFPLPIPGNPARKSDTARTGAPQPTARAAVRGRAGRSGGKRGADARSTRPILILLACVVGLAAIGGYLAINAFTQSATGWGAASSPSNTFAVNQAIPTSFGSVTVAHVEQIDGLTDEQMGSMSQGMGIGSLVPPDKVQIEVSVTLTNRLDYPVPYAPDAFALLTSKSNEPLSDDWTSIQPGLLQPKSSLEATFRFITARDASQLWLGFREDASDKPVRVNLGQTDQAPPDVLQPSNGHNHP